ncbi:zinc-binding alcohol dehydrogenase family protein [Nocardioides litoris]|uniref:zinc-binding alcohol dehydrogenase family protein n=1 Tax=Nocardioides litoris TaxID=1926648 RepID=UPI0011204F3C|nr:zinc-binding alcohol dehydrogenase family protein [Nocardioides litoris]
MSEQIAAVAAVVPSPGSPAVLADVQVDRPVAGEHDLLVEVRAVSVNPVDLKVRAGHTEGERVLGYDAAGVVVEVGPAVTLFAPGDEVFYAGSIGRPGTDAALHAVDERIVARRPASLSWAEAASLPLVSITAWEGLFDKLRLTAESRGTLLVVGATGGVGALVLQLADALLPGVRVVATASAANAEQARAWGAEATVDHHADGGDLQPQLAEAAPDGVDWVFTSRVEGEGQLALYEEVLNPFGEIVAIDDPEELDVAFLKPKSISFHWELMFTRPLAGGDAQLPQHHLLTRVAALVDDGRVTAPVAEELAPLDAATLERAHELVRGGRVVGKVVVAAGPTAG